MNRKFNLGYWIALIITFVSAFFISLVVEIYLYSCVVTTWIVVYFGLPEYVHMHFSLSFIHSWDLYIVFQLNTSSGASYLWRLSFLKWQHICNFYENHFLDVALLSWNLFYLCLITLSSSGWGIKFGSSTCTLCLINVLFPLWQLTSPPPFYI